MLSEIKYDKVVLDEDEDIMLRGDQIMNEFKKITEKMRERGIIPRIHYELIALRVLKVAAAVLIGAGILRLMVK